MGSSHLGPSNSVVDPGGARGTRAPFSVDFNIKCISNRFVFGGKPYLNTFYSSAPPFQKILDPPLILQSVPRMLKTKYSMPCFVGTTFSDCPSPTGGSTHEAMVGVKAYPVLEWSRTLDIFNLRMAFVHQSLIFKHIFIFDAFSK